MTKDQFLHAREDFIRRDRTFNRIYLTCFFGFLLAAIPLSSRIPEKYGSQAAFGLLAILVVNAVLVLWLGRNQAKREGLVCVSCGGGLLNRPGDIVFATGNCPHCGQPAFAGEA